jgi:hypothetical protein
MVRSGTTWSGPSTRSPNFFALGADLHAQLASTIGSDPPSIVWAPAASAAVLILTRLLRRSAVPALLVPAMVALPLSCAIVRRFIAAPPLRTLSASALNDALGATLGLAVLGLVLGGESVLRASSLRGERPRAASGAIVALGLSLVAVAAHLAQVKDPGIQRWAFVVAAAPSLLLSAGARRLQRDPAALSLGLAATGMIVWLALDALRMAKAPEARSFDVAAAETAKAFSAAAIEALFEALAVLVIALYALSTATSWGTRTAAALVLIIPSGTWLLAPLARATLLRHADPLALVVELGLDPPTATPTEAWWGRSSGQWYPSTSVLLLPGGGKPRFLASRAGTETMESAPEIVVLTAEAGLFTDFVADLRVLRERRHGLWLSVAPAGWRRLGLSRRLAERAETIALGVEPDVLVVGAPLPSDRGDMTDPLLGAMDPYGRTLGVVVHGSSARCVLLDARVEEGRLRYARVGDCASLPLDAAPGSNDRRMAVMRETGARRVLLAPGSGATMNDVVALLGTLTSELTRAMMERWEKACPPPAHCEPMISFETGSPLVWLTTDGVAIER